MTHLALVAYPVLDECDRRWIESIRARHDPQAKLIGAHFTLVFPAEMDRESVIAHASAVCARTRVVAFSATGMQAVREESGPGGHVFLVPGKGRREIAALHDELYEGIPRGDLRERRDFLPHITIAACTDFGECLRLARELETAGRTVKGRVDGVEVIVVSGDKISPVATLALNGAGRKAGPPRP
jgi:2'-5' RNA ligase